jgi:HEAT repeat protein
MKINIKQLTGLLEGLADSDIGLRRRTVAALAKYTNTEWEGSPEAVTAVITALLGPPRPVWPDNPTRVEVARTLGNIGSQSPLAVPELLRMLKEDRDTAVRAESARALGRIGEPAASAGRALAAALANTKGDDHLRGEAARALARVVPKAPSTTEALTEAAEDRSGHVGVAAAESLWRVSGDVGQAVPSLVARLSDPAVRQAAAQALYRIGTAAEAAVPHLLKAADSKDRLFREAVQMALLKIAPGAVKTSHK